jgi:MOSC domain-containing protein YiiM
MSSSVITVSLSPVHNFSKETQTSIKLLQGLGVEGDAHCGSTVKHRSRVAANPNQPNLRQVHLIHSELFDEVAQLGHSVQAGDMGENILTKGVDLLQLPRGTRLHIGQEAIVEITGLRNPCGQIDNFQEGLRGAVLERKEDGGFVRKAGVMAIVINGGQVSPGDSIRIELPAEPHQALDLV